MINHVEGFLECFQCGVWIDIDKDDYITDEKNRIFCDESCEHRQEVHDEQDAFDERAERLRLNMIRNCKHKEWKVVIKHDLPSDGGVIVERCIYCKKQRTLLIEG